MEDIINKFEHIISLKTEEKAKDDISLLIDLLKNTKLVDPETEWIKLKDNYSKLKYLEEIIKLNKDNEIHYKNHYFYKVLEIFMEKIELINKYYQNSFSLDPNFYQDSSEFNNNIGLPLFKNIIKTIGENLDLSINLVNPYEKLKYVVIAYDNLITLVENLRNEKYTDIEVIDPHFIKQFSNKRIKKNIIK